MIRKRRGQCNADSQKSAIFVKTTKYIDMRISYSDAAQMELLYAIKNIRTESELNELKLALSRFFADKAQKELDELWDSGVLDQKKLDELRKQHLRTPYRS